MGAYDFVTTSHGATVEEAFRKAKDTALAEYGHGRYTGTIAEKDDYTVITRRVLTEDMALAYASHLMRTDDERIYDKWGPAGAIPLEDDRWMFFGYASA